jgi:hypothetical protein
VLQVLLIVFHLNISVFFFFFHMIWLPFIILFCTVRH